MFFVKEIWCKNNKSESDNGNKIIWFGRVVSRLRRKSWWWVGSLLDGWVRLLTFFSWALLRHTKLHKWLFLEPRWVRKGLLPPDRRTRSTTSEFKLVPKIPMCSNALVRHCCIPERLCGHAAGTELGIQLWISYALRSLLSSEIYSWSAKDPLFQSRIRIPKELTYLIQIYFNINLCHNFIFPIQAIKSLSFIK
jgi:hypothetical protein